MKTNAHRPFHIDIGSAVTTTVRQLPLVAFLALSILVSAAGCSSPENDWKEAQKADNVDAYQSFTRKHPDSPLALEAKKKIEEKMWEEATRAETLVPYQKYLEAFPQGIHVAEAQKRIELTAIRGTVVSASDSSAIKGCQVYLIEVGRGGQVNATLSNDLMGVTDEHGNFSILVKRATLSKMRSIAFISVVGGSIGTSQTINLGAIPDDALVLNIGVCKMSS